jgi:hypothetical protein
LTGTATLRSKLVDPGVAGFQVAAHGAGYRCDEHVVEGGGADGLADFLDLSRAMGSVQATRLRTPSLPLKAVLGSELMIMYFESTEAKSVGIQLDALPSCFKCGIGDGCFLHLLERLPAEAPGGGDCRFSWPADHDSMGSRAPNLKRDAAFFLRPAFGQGASGSVSAMESRT